MKYLWFLLILLVFAPIPHAQVATSLGSGQFRCNSAGTSTITVTATNGISGTAALSCNNAVNSSLLAGCTVNASNAVTGCAGTYPPTGGWSQVAAQGFDGGALPAAQFINGNVECSFAHTGTCAVSTFISFDQASVEWGLNGGNIGTFSDMYASVWEYLDSNVAINDEMELGSLQAQDSSGNLLDELNFDRFGFVFNTTNPNLVIQPQGNAGGVYAGPPLGNLPDNLSGGSWHQWEMYYHPNTTGNADGVMTLYKDGKQMITTSPQNLNGPISMANAVFFVGGVYTKQIWTNNGQNPPSGTCVGLGNGQPISEPGNASFATLGGICPPTPPSFNRYMDDGILIKR